MDHGHIPVETLLDHGINTGTNSTKFVGSLLHKEQEQQKIVEENLKLFYLFSPSLGDLSGLKIDIDLD